MELHEVDYKIPNGKLIRLKAEVDDNKIKKISITGDFFLHPEEKIFELEKSLINILLSKESLQPIVNKVLADATMVGISSDEFVNALLKLQ